MKNKSVIIAVGDPAGCGPFITVKAISEILPYYKNTEFFVVSDEAVMRKIPLFKKIAKEINFIDAQNKNINKIKPGIPSRATAKMALSYLDAALILAKQNNTNLVTGPISKETVGEIINGFSGHTEYLADYFKVKHFEMMMVSSGLRVVLFTRHILLKDAGRLIKTKRLVNTIELVYSSLRRIFKIKKPKIALAAFNPHAGINTFLGREEKIMLSAIEKSGKDIYGPYPADSLFTVNNISKYDCIIASYHDQGMIPFKLASFKSGVNMTLGLPIVRTSPAHGPAYDIMRAGKIPFWSSMKEAIKLAIKLA